MNDPLRLSRDRGHSLAALLLSAAAEERPSVAAFERTTKAVAATAVVAAGVKGMSSLTSAFGTQHVANQAATGLSTGASGATGGASLSAGSTLGVGAIVKWIAVGALGGAAAVSSLHTLSTQPGEKTSTPLSSSNGALTSKSSPRSTVAAQARPEPASPPATSEPERPIALETQRAHTAEASPATLPKPETRDQTDGALLAAEVRFVDRGRVALQGGAFADALEQLASYEVRFPRQQLLTEVLFLRMEAFRRLGNLDRARALAASILTLGVTGRQAAQARQVLGS